MRIERLAALLSIAVLVGCESEVVDNNKPGRQLMPGLDVVQQPSPVPKACPECALPPTTFVRRDAQYQPFVREFPGDPAADYLFVVQDDGQPGTGADIRLNGERIIGPADLTSPSTVEIAKSLVLRAQNRLTVLPLGKPGSRVTIWVLSGTKLIDEMGGVVVASGGHGVVTVPAGAFLGPVRVAVGDNGGSTSIGGRWSTRAVSVTLTPQGTSTMSKVGAVTIEVPTTAPLPSGFEPWLLARVGAIPTALWAQALPTTRGFSLQLPTSEVDGYLSQPGQASFTLTLEGKIQRVMSGPAPSPRFNATQTASSTYCDPLPVNFQGFGAGQLPPGVLNCSDFPSLLLTKNSPTGLAGGAIVLVHGWSPDVATPIDLYREQGFDCDEVSANGIPQSYFCSKNGAVAGLPGETYFDQRATGAPASLLSEIQAAFPNTPVYTFTYASYEPFDVSGSQLAAALRSLAALTSSPRFVLVGHSMGGLVARSAAAQLAGPNSPITGLVTLGTMHEGTPAANSQLVRLGPQFLLGRGVLQPGTSSMLHGLSGQPLETTTITYAGKLHFANCSRFTLYIGCFPALSHSFSAGYYALSGQLLCNVFSDCDSDGLVPLASALAAGLTPLHSRTFDDFDHSDIKTGTAGTDVLRRQVVDDLRLLLGQGGGTAATACQPTQSQLFNDDFIGSAFGNVWQSRSGTWSVSSGLAVGYWSTSSANSQHGNLTYGGSTGSGDWIAETTLPPRNGSGLGDGGKLAMYLDANNVLHFNFEANNGRAFAQTLRNGVQSLTGGNPTANTVSFLPGANKIAVKKSGNVYTAYVNGTVAYTMTDTQLNGQGTIALGAYGTDEYDDFTVCGQQGSSLKLDGSNDFAEIPSSTAFDVDALTVEAWVRLDANVSGAQARIADRQSSATGGESWGLELFPGNQVVFHSGNCANHNNVLTGVNLQVGRWYHLAGVNDGTTLSVYVDGTLVSSAASPGAPCKPATAIPITVGQTGSYPNAYPSGLNFPGAIDELRVWGVARSALQISLSRGTQLSGSESGLVGYWRFDDGTGMTAADATGRGNHAVLKNGATWTAQTW